MRTLGLLLLLAAACLAQSGREAAPVDVHEWGVLVYGDDDDGGMLIGQPGMDEPAAVRAPVVYFHGPEFSGTFRVALPAGDFTITVPEPDEFRCDEAVWNITGSYLGRHRDSPVASVSIRRGVPAGGSVDWANVPSMMLATGSGALSRYLFYECTLDPELLEPEAWLAPVQYDGESLLLPPLLSIPEAPGDPELLVLTRSGDGPAMWRGTGSELAEQGLDGIEWSEYQRTEAMRAMMDWGAELLEPEELEVMWDTWEAWAVRRDSPDEYVIFTQLWPEKIERISRISLETEEGHPVEYSRFLLGALVVWGDAPVRRVSPDWGEDLR